MSHNKSPVIKDDICKTQQHIIESQRRQIKDLQEENTALRENEVKQQQQMSILKEIEGDYNALRVVFGNNGNLTYYQVMNTILTRKNAVIEAEKQRINFEHQQAHEAEAAAKRDAEEKAVIAENPSLLKYYQGEKDKIQQRKDTVLDAVAIRFYNMTDDEANLYFNDKHRPQNSAVMDLISEYRDEQKKFTIYQCNYCEKEVYSTTTKT